MSRSSFEDRVEIDSRRVEKVYSILARVYDGAFDWALGPGRRIAVSALPVQAGERVLEVGVGTGLSLPYYPSDCHVSGIDISEAMLERARERVAELGRTDIDLRLMDASALSYPDETFDHVLAPYVISVVPEPARVMAEIRRVCKPGGTVMVVNHFGSSAPGPLRWAESLLTPASQWIGFRLDEPLSNVTEAPGLETVRVEKVNLFGLWRLVELRRRA
jgi:phosphatidylethanolamine/phosphatidyl-N-methylethanolamine N-methyltransferase